MTLTIVLIAIAVVVLVFVLRYPYLGIVFTIASLPVADILPRLPYVSSVVPLIGALTIPSFLMSRKAQSYSHPFQFRNIHLLGILLIGWIFISNPRAAWFGRDRNWIFTFFQLWVLLWLAGELLDTPQKHKVLMWVYSLATVVSALFAIQQGNIGQNIDLDVRVSGLAEGANTAARYFVVALVLLNYLRTNTTSRFLGMVAAIGLIITFLAVFFTASRTGMMLLFAALGLLLVMQSRLRYRFQFLIILIAAWVMIWFLSYNILDILQSILPSIARGTDTVGLRYALWQAGWRMWIEYPIQGVGVGMYSSQLRYFAQDLIHPRFWSAVSHNMYVQMLAETGIVGFILFLLLLGKSLRNFWHSINSGDPEIRSLQSAWFVVFVILLLGGLTKTDQVDKMLWMTMGISVYFWHQFELQTHTVSGSQTIQPAAIS